MHKMIFKKMNEMMNDPLKAAKTARLVYGRETDETFLEESAYRVLAACGMNGKGVLP